MPTRRDAVSAAFDQVTRPRAIPDVEAHFASLKPHEHEVPGTGARIMRSLPVDQRLKTYLAAEEYLDQQALGKHGSTQYALDVHLPDKADQAGFTKFVEQLEIDDTAHRLQQRRGTDADLPPPDITRRDVLSAAFDAHSQEDTQ